MVLAGAWMVLVYLVAPVFIVAPVSVTTRAYLSWPRDGISARHYVNLFTNDMWLNAIWQSLVVTVASTLLAVIMGTLCAVGCWRVASRCSEAVRALMLTPIMVPGVVHALGFYRMWVDLRLLDTFTGVILVHIVTALPYVVITVSASLANFDYRLEQAARGLGASTSQAVRRVIVPWIMPGILSGAVFAFVSSWDEVVVLLFITSRRLYLLPRAMWDGINEAIDPTIAAVATVMILLTLLVLGVERLRAWRGARRDRRLTAGADVDGVRIGLDR